MARLGRSFPFRYRKAIQPPPVAPTLSLVGWRGYDDDAGESSATALAAENATFSRAVDTNVRIRTAIDETVGETILAAEPWELLSNKKATLAQILAYASWTQALDAAADFDRRSLTVPSGSQSVDNTSGDTKKWQDLSGASRHTYGTDRPGLIRYLANHKVVSQDTNSGVFTRLVNGHNVGDVVSASAYTVVVVGRTRALGTHPNGIAYSGFLVSPITENGGGNGWGLGVTTDNYLAPTEADANFEWFHLPEGEGFSKRVARPYPGVNQWFAAIARYDGTNLKLRVNDNTDDSVAAGNLEADVLAASYDTMPIFNDSDLLMVLVVNTALSDGSSDTLMDLLKRYNQIAWNSVNGSSSYVRSSASSNVADGAATTRRLSNGTGTFSAGQFDEVDGQATASISTLGGLFENEYCVQLRSADLTGGDVIQFAVRRVNTGEVLTLDGFEITAFAPSPVSDTVTFTDSRTVATTYRPSLSETVTFTDSRGVVQSLRVTLSDTATLTDTPTARQSLHATLSETVTFTDTIVAPVPGNRTDTITFTDTPVGQVRVAISSTITFTDSRTGTATLRGSLSDTVTFTDSRTVLATLRGTVTDTYTFTETPVGHATMLVSRTDTFIVSATTVGSTAIYITRPGKFRSVHNVTRSLRTGSQLIRSEG